MFDTKPLEELSRRLFKALPEGMGEMQQDLEKNFKSVLQSGFNKMNLVSREEFDVQSAVLLRTREKLDALQRQVEELETRLNSK